MGALAYIKQLHHGSELRLQNRESIITNGLIYNYIVDASSLWKIGGAALAASNTLAEVPTPVTIREKTILKNTPGT
jgi:hypothetical protein